MSSVFLFSLLSHPHCRGNASAPDVCNSLLTTVQTVGGNFNVYDVTKSCIGNLCYAGLADVSTYLSRADVLAALHVAPSVTNWTVSSSPFCHFCFPEAVRKACDATVYQKIATPDWFLQEEYVIPFLMDSYRVLIYNGVNDFICCHAGKCGFVPSSFSSLFVF